MPAAPGAPNALKRLVAGREGEAGLWAKGMDLTSSRCALPKRHGAFARTHHRFFAHVNWRNAKLWRWKSFSRPCVPVKAVRQLGFCE